MTNKNVKIVIKMFKKVIDEKINIYNNWEYFPQTLQNNDSRAESKRFEYYAKNLFFNDDVINKVNLELELLDCSFKILKFDNFQESESKNDVNPFDIGIVVLENNVEVPIIGDIKYTEKDTVDNCNIFQGLFIYRWMLFPDKINDMKSGKTRKTIASQLTRETLEKSHPYCKDFYIWDFKKGIDNPISDFGVFSAFENTDRIVFNIKNGPQIELKNLIWDDDHNYCEITRKRCVLEWFKKFCGPPINETLYNRLKNINI